MKLFQAETLSNFYQHHFSGLLVPREYSLVRNAHIDTLHACDWERTPWCKLSLLFVCMLHCNNDPLNAGHEVHRTTHTLDHLPRNNPVSEVASLGDLQPSENRKVHVTASYHCERLTGSEERSARVDCNRDLTSVDQVRI